MTQHKKPAFTLIELLIVITIIGILAVFVIASFNSAQQKSRDAKRKSDLDAVKKALELVRSDCTFGSYYPLIAGSRPVRYESLKTYLIDLNYMKNPPQDPLFTDITGTNWYEMGFVSNSPTNNVCPVDGTDPLGKGNVEYWLRATLENTNDPAGAESQAKCGGLPSSATFNWYYVCSQ